MRNIFKVSFFKVLLLAAIIAVAGSFIQTGYYLVRPGMVEDLGRMIRVQGEERREEGQFLMITITQQPASVWNFLYGSVHPVMDLHPISRVIPPDMTREEYNKLMQSWMQDSKNLAQVIALRRAGYDVPIVSDGVEIVDLLPESPAEGTLHAGDVIRSIDGEGVYLAEEVVRQVQKKEIGEEVNLVVKRGDEVLSVDVVTAANPEEPGIAALKVYVRTLNWQPLLPLEVDIETGPVIGPSAGMMFVLEILDRLYPQNLTGGHRVGGTGTITIDEKIGSIGGVKQKVIAAERAGLQYFLVPGENYDEALGAANSIEIVPVADLDDVLEFLSTLQLRESSLRDHALPLCA